jgi:predicted Zn finger-like uncharacterized protein
MITTCTHCQARYQLEEARIPRRRIRVRCPACQGVFGLDGTLATAEVEQPRPVVAAEPTPAPEAPVTAPERPADPMITSGFSDPMSAPMETPAPEAESFSAEPASRPMASSPAAPSAPSAPASPATAAADADLSAPVAVLDEGAPGAGRKRRRRSKEEMMARALVSDILVYNREARDAALAEGNLLEALGAEIKKSWELYKEKVTPEVANSTNHFRDALNEILAEGEKVF